MLRRPIHPRSVPVASLWFVRYFSRGTLTILTFRETMEFDHPRCKNRLSSRDQGSKHPRSTAHSLDCQPRCAMSLAGVQEADSGRRILKTTLVVRRSHLF